MDVDSQANCKFVYLVFYNNLILAGEPDNIDIDFARRTVAQNITVIMGKESIITLLRESLHSKFKYIENNMWYLKDDSNLMPDNKDAKIAQLDDVDKIHSFLMSFENLKNRYASKDMIVNRIKNNDGTHVYIEKDGKILAHGNSTARSDYSVMIGGLASCMADTNPELELAIVSYLSSLILKTERYPCLFSEKDLVRELGFSLFGKWSTLELKS